MTKPKDLKLYNRHKILNYVRSKGIVTIDDISMSTQMSRTIISRGVRFFKEHNLITDNGKGSSTFEGGKKPQLFSLNCEYGYFAVVHILTETIYSAIADLKGSIVAEKKTLIEKNASQQKVVETICSDVSEMLSSLKCSNDKLLSVAVGAHGIANIDKGTVLISPHFSSWGNNFNLADSIRKGMNVGIPVYVDNQIRFQALAEMELGDNVNCSNAIIIQAGVGLVAGVLIDGEIRRGANSLLGEIGHTIIDPEEKTQCHCGNFGCFETKVSFDKGLEYARDISGRYPDSPYSEQVNQTNFDMRKIFQGSNEDDKFCKEVVNILASWFAIGMSNLILSYDPELIIIQGEYAQAGSYFLNTMSKCINNMGILKDISNSIPIRYSHLGDKRCLLGAAYFAVEKFFENIDSHIQST